MPLLTWRTSLLRRNPAASWQCSSPRPRQLRATRARCTASVSFVGWAMLGFIIGCFLVAAGSSDSRVRARLGSDVSMVGGGAGITWMQRKGKLIISGFMPGSLARQSGCQIGDILRAVDDNEVVHFRPTANVRPDPHPPWTVHEVIVV
mmetsp:Transcript_3121/g.6298  ORF Transcript_3121/g.6298 Transcript_3121/m.6298 type:complete len:148 (-) Transcript_3121:435-878(-)